MKPKSTRPKSGYKTPFFTGTSHTDWPAYDFICKFDGHLHYEDTPITSFFRKRHVRRNFTFPFHEADNTTTVYVELHKQHFPGGNFVQELHDTLKTFKAYKGMKVHENKRIGGNLEIKVTTY